MTKFFICGRCGNIIDLVKNGGGPLVCCGKPMDELVANTTEASTEKHLPHVTKTENGIHVQVGSVVHPMEEAHHIEFIYVETKNGGQRVNLGSGDTPEADFYFAGTRPVAAYEYCNLHGLWKTELN